MCPHRILYHESTEANDDHHMPFIRVRTPVGVGVRTPVGVRPPGGAAPSPSCISRSERSTSSLIRRRKVVRSSAGRFTGQLSLGTEIHVGQTQHPGSAWGRGHTPVNGAKHDILAHRTATQHPDPHSQHSSAWGRRHAGQTARSMQPQQSAWTPALAESARAGQQSMDATQYDAVPGYPFCPGSGLNGTPRNIGSLVST